MLADFIIRQKDIELEILRKRLAKPFRADFHLEKPEDLVLDDEYVRYLREKTYKALGVPAHLIEGRKEAEITIKTVEVKEHPTRRLKSGYTFEPYSPKIDDVDKSILNKKHILNCEMCGLCVIEIPRTDKREWIFCPSCGRKI